MRSATVVMTGLALLLGACDLSQPGNGTQPDAGAQMNTSNKLRAYGAVITDDVATVGLNLEEDLKRYQALDIAHADPKEKIELFPLSLEQALKDLKAARAEPGLLPELDAAADRAIPALEKLLTRLRGLDSYYATRGPLTDQFARGRREDALLIADYQAAIAAWKPLRAAFEAARDKDLVQSAAFYQREGRMVEYYDIALAQKATELARTIDTPQAAGDPTKAAQAERIVGVLLSLVERSRAARSDLAARATRVGSVKAQSVTDADSATDTSVLDNRVPENVEEMIGAWRDLRRVQNADAREKMMQPYARVMAMVSL